MTERGDFLDAWQQHDYAAERQGARRGATSETLKVVTDRLMVARDRYARLLDLTAMQLHDLCIAWRRAGLNHEDSLRAVEAGREATTR